MPPLPNQRQERFARALVSGKSASKAYELAGYEPNRHNASRLKTNENVNRRIRELAMPAAKRAQVTADSLLEELEEARLGAVQDRQWSAAVSASMGRARITGKDTARVEVGVNMNFETMRADEIEAALIKLLQDHGVIAAEPEMIDIAFGHHEDRRQYHRRGGAPDVAAATPCFRLHHRMTVLCAASRRAPAMKRFGSRCVCSLEQSGSSL